MLWQAYMHPPPPIPVCAQLFTPCSECVANAAQVDKGGGYVGKWGGHMQEGGGVCKAVLCRRKGECACDAICGAPSPGDWVQRPDMQKGEPCDD